MIRLGTITLLLLSHSLLAPCLLAQSATTGKSNFEFVTPANKVIRVWTWTPEAVKDETPVLFVIHGVNRDAERYLEEWVPLGQKHQVIIVVPEFDRKAFPQSDDFNHGGVLDRDKKPTPASAWSFSVIEPLFDTVKARTGTKVVSYKMYGHSAGSQFVHRFNYFIADARCDFMIAANAGSYAMPDFQVEYPFGLKRSGIDESTLKKAFAHRLLILLGTEDKDPNHSQLPKQPEAMAQGPHRLARGEAYYRRAKALAEEKEAMFQWKLEYVPGVAHQNGKMAIRAAEMLFGT